jgi:hypothetical protein
MIASLPAGRANELGLASVEGGRLKDNFDLQTVKNLENAR